MTDGKKKAQDESVAGAAVEVVAAAKKAGLFKKAGPATGFIVALVGMIATGAMKIQSAYDYITALEGKVTALENRPAPADLSPQVRELERRLELQAEQTEALRATLAGYTELQVRFSLLQTSYSTLRSNFSQLVNAVNQILVLMAQHRIGGVTNIHPPVFTMGGGFSGADPYPAPSEGVP